MFGSLNPEPSVFGCKWPYNLGTAVTFPITGTACIAYSILYFHRTYSLCVHINFVKFMVIYVTLWDLHEIRLNGIDYCQD